MNEELLDLDELNETTDDEESPEPPAELLTVKLFK